MKTARAKNLSKRLSKKSKPASAQQRGARDVRQQTKAKNSYHHDNLRGALIAEALGFLKNGRAEDLSLRDLARKIGVSHMAPYRHFQTKEDLLAAIIEDGFNKLSEKFELLKAQGVQEFSSINFELAFRNQGKAYIQFVLDNPDQARLMFSGLLCDPHKHLAAHEAGQKTFLKLVDLIRLGQMSGYIKKEDDPHFLGLVIWSAVHGSAMLMIENQFSMIEGAPELEIDNYMDFMTKKMLYGLKK